MLATPARASRGAGASSATFPESRRPMSVFGTKRTAQRAQTMSALEGKADAVSHYGNDAPGSRIPPYRTSHDRPVNASPLSTIGRKRMAKTLGSSPPHNNLGHKARLHGSHCHQPHDKHQPSTEPHRSNWLLDRVDPLRNRGNP